MADFNDVATNENIQAIADAIRYVTGYGESMTIPEMPVVLNNYMAKVGVARVGISKVM